MQGDGNFVVYTKKNKHIWSSNTHGMQGQKFLVLQGDGNLVLYNPSAAGAREHPKWASKTNGKAKDCILVMQDDGNLVLYNGYKRAIWASGKYVGEPLEYDHW